MSTKEKRITAIVLLAAAGVLLWWSTKRTLVWARERRPLEISCADYSSTRPRAQWIRLTHCEADFQHMAVETKEEGGRSRPRAVYIPLHAEGIRSASSVVVIERDDPAILELAATEPDRRPHLDLGPIGLGVGSRPTDDEPPTVDPRAQKVIDELRRPLEGMVTTIDDPDEVVDLNLGVAAGFVVLQPGRTPDAAPGFAGLFVGLLVGVIAARVLVRDLVRRPGAESKLEREKRLTLGLNLPPDPNRG